MAKINKETNIPNGVYVDNGEILISLDGAYYSINLMERHLFERHLDPSEPVSLIQLTTLKGDYVEALLHKKYTEGEKVKDSEELSVHNAVRAMISGIMSGMSKNEGTQTVNKETSYSFCLETMPGHFYESYLDKLLVTYLPTNEVSFHSKFYLIPVLYNILKKKWIEDINKD